MKCECVCDNFQRRTEVQGSLGHMNTWGLGLSAAVPRPDLWELGNKEIYFLVNLFFSLILLLSLVHLLGSISLFKLFFSTGPFESFQCFLNPDPRPLFVDFFLFLPRYCCYLFFTITLQAAPSFPPVFLVYLHISDCFFFLVGKKHRGSNKVLHTSKGLHHLLTLQHHKSQNH